MSKLEFGNMLDNIRFARISGELMRAEERGEELGIALGLERGFKQGSVCTRDEIYSKAIPILLNNYAPDELSSLLDIPVEDVLKYSN